ncbi:hypothetical protein QOZ80_7BG0603440 [Eleusine coracana subsp. coracana]|nr:hypothetical protein QOZ80_7BG0603440 [Eleusine coracana subsp. coracana]
MSSSVVAGGGRAACEEEANLREPLLANGDGGALATVVVANVHGGGGGSFKAKGAVKTKDGYWVDDVHKPDARSSAADLESGGGRPLLFSNKKVMASLLYPYRVLIMIRLVAIFLFIGWRIKHHNSDVMWFWAASVSGDIWFAFSWLLYQLPKYNPIKRTPDLAALRRHNDDDLPDGGSILPGIDIVVTTADPISEPVLYTMNCVLSILAVDYPVDRYTCYLADDSGALILYESLVETADFAALWVPFCRKHSVEPRAPESYFEKEGMIYTGRSPSEFVKDYRHVQREYEKFKVRLETLPRIIEERSDVYKEGSAKATWMANGTQWPGTWVEPAEHHRKGHHAGIVEIVQEHPSLNKPQQDQKKASNNVTPLNFDGVDARLPMLVYVSREKSPSYEHNKKAGALNAQLRISALLSNAPFFINFDCDHYISNSQALRAAMCFFLDPREGDNTAFVQSPQRFENVDPTDRYGNHNRVFFDGVMYALNGLQGPTYLGTGCMFRRLALYGVDPPRWRPDEITVDSNRFGNSMPFLNSVLTALKQERRIAPPEIDEAFRAEMTMVVSSAYDQGTDWGRGTGYIYNIATEDIVTGYRIHGQGWRSMYCTMEVDAFRGTAPINLTERLYQIIRWSGGSLEVFFSPYNPLFSGRRLHLIQRAAYLNCTIYPVTSLFILLYAFCPAMWLIPDEILIQKPFTRYVVYVIIIVALIHIIGALEIKWAGVTWRDWWRNEQFFMTASLSAYPTALLHMVVKPLTGKGIHFRVTSKQTTTEDDDDKYADMYEMRWVPMLIPAAVVLFSNIMAIGVAMGKAVVYGGTWPPERRAHAALGLLFNVWMMAMLQPFALAVMGRWSKRPGILLVLLPVAFVVVMLVYIGVHALLVKFLPFIVI